MSSKNTPLISVIIPTFHRPNGAKAAALSVLNQENITDFEIIIIDNDKEKSAQSAADEIAQIAKEKNINFIYSCEPKSGVANARNSAVKLANGEFIAFLDDDEVAFSNWLFELSKTQKETNAWVVFGPIQARLNEGSDEPKEYFEEFFSRKRDDESNITDRVYGCGNSYMNRALVLNSDTPFNPKTNETGGEDDLLFRKVSAQNGIYGWAKDAWVYEDVPRLRASYSYLTPRAFAYGHNTSSKCFDKNNPDYIAGIISMARGALQTFVMGIVTLALWAIKHPKRAWAYDKMLRGLGKVLWFGPFKQSFYGEAAKKYMTKPQAN